MQIKKEEKKMERNQNGYPIRNAAPSTEENMNGADTTHSGSECINSMPLAYCYVPMQSFRLLYEPEKALCRGTLFEELDLPLGVYKNGK